MIDSNLLFDYSLMPKDVHFEDIDRLKKAIADNFRIDIEKTLYYLDLVFNPDKLKLQREFLKLDKSAFLETFKLKILYIRLLTFNSPLLRSETLRNERRLINYIKPKFTSTGNYQGLKPLYGKNHRCVKFMNLMIQSDMKLANSKDYKPPKHIPIVHERIQLPFNVQEMMDEELFQH